MILKLGGSLITNKDIPLSANENNLGKIAKAIHESGLPAKNRGLILVHGGGSFGHYFAKKFNLSTERDRIKPLGISWTAEAMLKLHVIVVESLLSDGIATETIPPSELVDPKLLTVSERGRRHLESSLANGLIPITFGYVALDGNKAFIVSGDSICKALAESMPVERVLFAMDVDGIYPTFNLKGRIITKLSGFDGVNTKLRLYDVTGGLRSKLDVGLQIHKLGSQVFYVNGTKAIRVANLLAGKPEKLATEIAS